MTKASRSDQFHITMKFDFGRQNKYIWLDPINVFKQAGWSNAQIKREQERIRVWEWTPENKWTLEKHNKVELFADRDCIFLTRKRRNTDLSQGGAIPLNDETVATTIIQIQNTHCSTVLEKVRNKLERLIDRFSNCSYFSWFFSTSFCLD
jgi:hypothetical protein